MSAIATLVATLAMLGQQGAPQATDPLATQLREFNNRRQVVYAELDETYKRLVREAPVMSEAAQIEFDIIKVQYLARFGDYAEFIPLFTSIVQDQARYRKGSFHRVFLLVEFLDVRLSEYEEVVKLYREIAAESKARNLPYEVMRAHFNICLALNNTNGPLNLIIDENRNTIAMARSLNLPNDEYTLHIYRALFRQSSIVLQLSGRYRSSINQLHEALEVSKRFQPSKLLSSYLLSLPRQLQVCNAALQILC